MADYNPHLDPQLWAAIKPFVDQTVKAATNLTPYTDRELYAVVTPLAAWMRNRVGLPLENDIALDPRTIDRFVMEGLAHYTKAGRGTMRSRLRRLSETLEPELGEPARERPLPKSERCRPYSSNDIGALYTWAHHLPTQIGRNARCLLALGFGAGLIGTEFGRLRVRDLIVSEEGIDVRVTGERTRIVPVVAEWAEPLIDCATTDASDAYVFRVSRQTTHRNVITNFVGRHPPPLGLQARRMRATWMVTQLNAGTPVTLLLRAAGLASAEGLDPFLAHTHNDRWNLGALRLGDSPQS